MGNYRLHIIATPGHTPGSVSIFEKNTNILFAGDLLFAEGSVGRSDFKYSDPEVLRVSLSKIMKLPKETIVYSGHGEPFTLKEFGKYWYN